MLGPFRQMVYVKHVKVWTAAGPRQKYVKFWAAMRAALGPSVMTRRHRRRRRRRRRLLRLLVGPRLLLLLLLRRRRHLLPQPVNNCVASACRAGPSVKF